MASWGSPETRIPRPSPAPALCALLSQAPCEKRSARRSRFPTTDSGRYCSTVDKSGGCFRIFAAILAFAGVTLVAQRSEAATVSIEYVLDASDPLTAGP